MYRQRPFEPCTQYKATTYRSRVAYCGTEKPPRRGDVARRDTGDNAQPGTGQRGNGAHAHAAAIFFLQCTSLARWATNLSLSRSGQTVILGRGQTRARRAWSRTALRLHLEQPLLRGVYRADCFPPRLGQLLLRRVNTKRLPENRDTFARVSIQVRTHLARDGRGRYRRGPYGRVRCVALSGVSTTHSM